MSATSRIRWYPPLDSVKGRETELELNGPIRLADLLKRFCDEDKRLQRFTQFDFEKQEVIGFMVLRGDALLKQYDTVEPGTDLDILSAIDGG